MNLKKLLAGAAFASLLLAQSCRETEVELPQEGDYKKELLNRNPQQDSIVIPQELPNPKDPKDSPGK